MTMSLLQDRGSEAAPAKTRRARPLFMYEVFPSAPMLYGILLAIDHPDIEPKLISKRLRRDPQHGWRAGDLRATPDGTVLPGVRKTTYWGLSKQKRGHRAFFDGIKDMLDLLERHTDFVRQMIDEGGKVSITVQLSGRQNIGDVLQPADMGRMATLGVSLGVEVFPDFTP